jgi:hypothetical protein
MDEGLLSEPRLLEASRSFVCVRLITYQDRAESAFLKTLGASATGGVLNTSFALLAPDGETVLSGTGRSPQQGLGVDEGASLDRLLASMEDIAGRYEAKRASGAVALPYLASFKVALNVASCDNQPLVVVSTETKAAKAAIERRLAPLAWESAFRGRFAFAHSVDGAPLGSLEGAPVTDSVLVVQPGTYGLEGTVIAQTSGFSEASLRRLLERGISGFRGLAKGRGELRQAKRRGLRWEEDTADREPDPSNSRRARRRGER